jgi:heme exporter protein CcmD
MPGTVTGGWEYVIAAYAVTALILIGYAVSVVLRHRQELARLAREKGRGHTPS